MAEDAQRFLVCSLDGPLVAFRLDDVERAVRTVEITPVPGPAPGLLGFVNYGGVIVPVVSLRAAFGMNERAPLLSDQLIIARTNGRLLALPVACSAGMVTISDQMIVSGRPLGPALHAVDGVFAADKEIVLILDLASLLGTDAWDSSRRTAAENNMLAAG